MEIHFFRGEKRRTENPHFTLQTKIMEDFIIDEISYPITVGFKLPFLRKKNTHEASLQAYLMKTSFRFIYGESGSLSLLEKHESTRINTNRDL